VVTEPWSRTRLTVADGIEHPLHPRQAADRCSWFCHPTGRGLSLALLDAMGAGVYGLAGDPRMENWSGLTFERGSAAYLGGMIRFRLANPVIRQAAGRAANRRIRKHYLRPKVVRIWRRFILIEWAGKL
jgi:hypothetical protein